MVNSFPTGYTSLQLLCAVLHTICGLHYTLYVLFTTHYMCTAILTIYRAILHPTPYTPLMSSLSSSPIYRPYKPYSLIQQPQTTDSNQLINTAIHFIVLHYKDLYWKILHCTALQCTALNSSSRKRVSVGRRSEYRDSPVSSLLLQTVNSTLLHCTSCRLQTTHSILHLTVKHTAALYKL